VFVPIFTFPGGEGGIFRCPDTGVLGLCDVREGVEQAQEIWTGHQGGLAISILKGDPPPHVLPFAGTIAAQGCDKLTLLSHTRSP